MNPAVVALADQSNIPVWGWKGWALFALAVLFVWATTRFRQIRAWHRGDGIDLDALDRVAPAAARISVKCRQRGHFYRANHNVRRWECQRDGCEESHPMAQTVPDNLRRTS